MIDTHLRYRVRENRSVEDTSGQGAFPSTIQASYTVIVCLAFGRGRLGDDVCSCPNRGERVVALFQTEVVRNRLLSALSPDDFVEIEPMLERVPLQLQAVLIEAHRPIEYVYFPESGIASTVADAQEGRIEIGLIGREGMIGFPVILGVDQTPHNIVVQGAGEALRISVQDLRAAIQARPSIFRPLGLFAHTLFVQVGQTAYANVTFNVEARLARWILMTQDRTDGDELLLTHEFLSVMLGVRRPGVTIATHALEGIGSIRTRAGASWCATVRSCWSWPATPMRWPRTSMSGSWHSREDNRFDGDPDVARPMVRRT